MANFSTQACQKGASVSALKFICGYVESNLNPLVSRLRFHALTSYSSSEDVGSLKSHMIFSLYVKIVPTIEDGFGNLEQTQSSNEKRWIQLKADKEITAQSQWINVAS